jgi:flagellar basal body-associated protein FliL
MQKAKLDILENIPDIDITGAMSETDEVSEISPISGKKWASNKLILLVSTLGLVVVVIAGGLWFHFTKSVSLKHEEKIVISGGDNFGKESEEASKAAGSVTESGSTSTPVVPLADKVITIYFKDFIIDLKDTSGKSKILVCDVAIDISENQNVAQLVNNKDVRKIIYRTAKGKSAVALRSMEERKRLKNEMAKELEKMLGEGIVKNVYFTNYIIM